MKRTNKKGFTIVELVIVIAVIAILAAVLIPNISRLVKKANESSDIQAVRNMNTFLAAEGATGDIKSILDVYDLFVDSGYNVKSYSPLYSGRHFYYDKQYNQILYVETESGKVLFPEERKNDNITTTLKNHDLFSLSMEVPTLEKVEIDTKTDSGTMSATVSTAGQYAYVIEEYNKKADSQGLTLTVKGTIDLMGAQCLINDAKGDIKIIGKESAIIKNATSNTFTTTNTNNTNQIKTDYYCSALVGRADGHEVTIENVSFENLNVKNVTSGSVALLVGFNNKRVTINNVTIKNSSVIGHRSVGALIGQATGDVTMTGNVKLENVSVKTVGGRSALLIGHFGNTKDKKINLANATISIDDKSKLSIYDEATAEQQILDGNVEKTADYTIKVGGQEKLIYSFYGYKDSGKKYSAFGYKSNALVLVSTDNAWTAYTTIDEIKTAYN